MGMFDELKCEYPLPRPKMQGCTFQTKSMECMMEHYTITAEGRLICHPSHLETNPDWVDDPTNKGFSRYVGSMRSIPDPDYDTEHHGDVYFYAFDGLNDRLVTFRARFTEGQVTSIVEVSEE